MVDRIESTREYVPNVSGWPRARVTGSISNGGPPSHRASTYFDGRMQSEGGRTWTMRLTQYHIYHTYLAGLAPLLQHQHVGVHRVGGDAPHIRQQGAVRAANTPCLRPDAAGADARVASLFLCVWYINVWVRSNQLECDVIHAYMYGPEPATWAPAGSAGGRGSARRPSAWPPRRSRRLFD